MPECPFPVSEIEVVGFGGSPVADGSGTKFAMLHHPQTDRYWTWNPESGAKQHDTYHVTVRHADLWTQTSLRPEFQKDAMFLYVGDDFLDDGVVHVLHALDWSLTWDETAQARLTYCDHDYIDCLRSRWADGIVALAVSQLQLSPDTACRLAMRAQFCIPVADMLKRAEAHSVAYASFTLRDDRAGENRILNLVRMDNPDEPAAEAFIRFRAKALLKK